MGRKNASNHKNKPLLPLYTTFSTHFTANMVWRTAYIKPPPPTIQFEGVDFSAYSYSYASSAIYSADALRKRFPCEIAQVTVSFGSLFSVMLFVCIVLVYSKRARRRDLLYCDAPPTSPYLQKEEEGPLSSQSHPDSNPFFLSFFAISRSVHFSASLCFFQSQLPVASSVAKTRILVRS